MKRYKIITILALVAILCLFTAACSDTTKIDDYKEQGYTVMVTYDGNGGDYIGSSSIRLLDMFNPDNYEADDTNTVHIKLTEPTSPTRPSGGSDPVTLTKRDYFFAGWYRERQVMTNDAGEVVDWDGNVLEERFGVYYLKDAEEETIGYPACVSYSGYWDFETDTLDVSLDNREVELTLYAGWVPYYQFDYYYQDNGAWTKYAQTTFDYKTTNREGSTSSDRDTIFMPSYQNGAMNYSSKYEDGRTYDFPKLAGYTFNSAYTDSQCENQISVSYEHPGTLDLATGTAQNRVVNIYVVFDVGEIYYIETAQQFYDNANSQGVYYIENDLDFTSVQWPNAIMLNTFTGKIYGQNHKFSNVKVTFNSTAASLGGLFGAVADTAVIQNLTVENLTVDYAASGRIHNGYFGLFAGNIEEGAQVSATLSGNLEMRLGNVSFHNSSTFNVIANGDRSGLTLNAVTHKLFVYGTPIYGQDEYDYVINYENVSVDPDGLINFEVSSVKRYDQAQYEISFSLGG